MHVVTTGTRPCCSARHATLTETRNFAGTAVVIFQPAEEGGVVERKWSTTG